MYTGYLFIIAFAVLITNTICDDSVTVNSDGKVMSMSTHDLCTKAGFVKDTVKTVNTKDDAKAAAAHIRYTGNIILAILGVTAGVLILAFAGHYYYHKQKVN